MASDPRPPVVLLMGSTASGKTELARTLCGEFPLDVVSVDSAMVYRGMNIGTAKPDADFLRQCPHRLIDICDPAEAYSAGRFLVDANREIEQIHNAGRIPLLVGGTMLYFRALQQGLASLPAADPVIRAELDAEATRIGWPAVHETLAQVDPAAAARIKPQDGQRIQRALEVYRLSGQTLSYLQATAQASVQPRDWLKLALWPSDLEAQRVRIGNRFRAMLDAGFVAEVEMLKQRPDILPGLPSMRAVGYRQIWEFLQGRCELAEAERRGVIATCQLAKRQRTWLRAEKHLFRMDTGRGAADSALHHLAGKIPRSP
ncbi:MAG: tRNA (adenosine(37)-N6)-dimethylallyltransferase MiaA [Gammaproteobacteria bacterium]